MTGQANERRRFIRSRHTNLAMKMTKWLAERGFRPNQVSLLSIVFSLIAALCLARSPYYGNVIRFLLFASAAFFILMRLLCNLLDGMLAIEEGHAGKTGEIYNDLPDRPSDIFIFLGAGYAISGMPGGFTLGWVTAILAVLTAYVRLLGSVVGAKHYFLGPMAKQQRMALMILACILCALGGEAYYQQILMGTLIIISCGCFLTIFRRLKCIVADLERGVER